MPTLPYQLADTDLECFSKCTYSLGETKKKKTYSVNSSLCWCITLLHMGRNYHFGPMSISHLKVFILWYWTDDVPIWSCIPRNRAMTITIRLHIKLISEDIELLPRTTYLINLWKGCNLTLCFTELPAEHFSPCIFLPFVLNGFSRNICIELIYRCNMLSWSNCTS